MAPSARGAEHETGSEAAKARLPPRVGYVDATVPLFMDPYRFISRHARAVGADVFQTRILMQNTLCMVGAAAARAFYDGDLFVREGAAPRRIKKTLLGEGGVQGLDGEAHRQRKAMFMGILDEAGVRGLADATAEEMAGAADLWRGKEVVLYDEIRALLTRAVCDWAGVPLDDPARRTKQLTALFQHAGDMGPPHWGARLARQQAEQWTGSLIERVREGDLHAAPGTALATMAGHQQADGSQMPSKVAAVELLNVLRPTVAVSVYITLLAHAMHAYPQPATADQREAFVQEVRRFYPFFPATVARVKQDTEWNGFLLPGGTRAMLDLHGTNHDARAWEAPDEFRPQRFLDQEPDAYEFAPHGAGHPARGHRCAGESATGRIMGEACRFLMDLDYDLPRQDLRIQIRSPPALPRSGFVMHVR